METHKRTAPSSSERPPLNEKRPYDATPPWPTAHEAFGEENKGFLPLAHVPQTPASGLPKLPRRDLLNFVVLVVLYTVQGVPVGLAFGSVPFILKSKVSYSQMGVFLLASYPYSLKLLWSPIVDAVYSRRVGRRKSWIIPVQLMSGATLIYLGSVVDLFMDEPSRHLGTMTRCFFVLIFLCATQDIAVDGWALTCLSPESLSFASTAQTIGMNCGYFLSFTVFLSLSSPEFANKYFYAEPAPHGLFGLGSYLTFWGWMYVVVTGAMVFVPEEPAHLRKRNIDGYSAAVYKNEDSNNRPISARKRYWNDLCIVYALMMQVLRLPNIRTLVVIHLLAKLGFQVNEVATNLKLLEKGFSKEDLSIAVLVDFPFEMILGFYAGRWSSGKAPLRPWLFSFAGRLFSALAAHLILLFFPEVENGRIPCMLFLVIIVQNLFNSFMSTVQLVSLCAFHTKIADPSIGGTYMTSLNTLSNYGGTWPRLIIFYLIDRFTVAHCRLGPTTGYLIHTEGQKQDCLGVGGQVHIVRDGYFWMSAICIMLGVVIFFWVKRKIVHLQAMPQSAWRVNHS
ncbi:hypothetical protein METBISCDRAFT_20764 [Metschnikowia bicuspidata]|uniref:MFS general substrate transporter n=2 Tax=Metschnikowia bicuspidata TaxID=27322 RepID=A0A4P9Z6V7_9ASCO|nr:hypothetical protein METBISCDRAFT_20764 [Metschnikowia bicuspidata]